jgi:hypothetical protein
MSTNLTRRNALRLALVATAATTAGLAVAGPAQAGRSPAGCTTCAPVPDVPGMLGDPRANEFWYQMDYIFFEHPSPDIINAYGAFSQAIGGYNQVWDLWLASRQAGTYPDSFTALVAPAHDALAFLSQEQLKLYDCYYRHDFAGLTESFVQFGEGVLYDPRRDPDEVVHTMDPSDGGPPKNYHRWHAIIQANLLLGIDAQRWRPIDNLLGLGWGIQSIAKPAMDHVNPPLPRRVLEHQRRFWLSRSLSQLNTAFESFPYPPGTS